MHYAVKTGRVEIVKSLVDAGAEMHVLNKAGRGVLEGCSNSEIIALLGGEKKTVALLVGAIEGVDKDERRVSSLPLEVRDIEAQTDVDPIELENASLRETNARLLAKVEALDAKFVVKNDRVSELEKEASDQGAFDSIVDMQAKKIKELEASLAAGDVVIEDEDDRRPFMSCINFPTSPQDDLQLRLSILRSSQKEISDTLVDTNDTIIRMRDLKHSLETGKRISLYSYALDKRFSTMHSNVHDDDSTRTADSVVGLAGSEAELRIDEELLKKEQESVALQITALESTVLSSSSSVTTAVDDGFVFLEDLLTQLQPPVHSRSSSATSRFSIMMGKQSVTSELDTSTVLGQLLHASKTRIVRLKTMCDGQRFENDGLRVEIDEVRSETRELEDRFAGVVGISMELDGIISRVDPRFITPSKESADVIGVVREKVGVLGRVVEGMGAENGKYVREIVRMRNVGAISDFVGVVGAGDEEVSLKEGGGRPGSFTVESKSDLSSTSSVNTVKPAKSSKRRGVVGIDEGGKGEGRQSPLLDRLRKV